MRKTPIKLSRPLKRTPSQATPSQAKQALYQLRSIPRHQKRIDPKLQTLSSKSVCLGSGSTVLGGGYWGAGAPHPPPNPILYRRSPDKPIHSGPGRFHPQTPKKDRPPGPLSRPRKDPCGGPGKDSVFDGRPKSLDPQRSSEMCVKPQS